jgi:hypothetical protein
MEVSLGFGIRVCDYCHREFEEVRQIQHLCGPECHDHYFRQERKQALKLWRAQQRVASFFGTTVKLLDDADDSDNQELREAG